MSYSSLHCSHCHEQHRPIGVLPARQSCKNVKIVIKSVDRASSPLKLISPCGGYDDLPRMVGRCESEEYTDCEENPYCLHHSNREQTGTSMAQRFCCTPTTECNQCKCSQTCEMHGPNCPHTSDNHPRIRTRNWARVDPDPLK